MRESTALETILGHLRRGGHLSLFLDYDGTLRPLAPTPDEAVPDEPLLELLAQLSHDPLIHLVIISGRSAETLREWLPIDGIVIAGIYGAEILKKGNTNLRGIPADQGHSVLVEVKSKWRQLVDQRDGFLIEDKRLAVALHARWAKREEADYVLDAAKHIAIRLIDPDLHRLLDGDRFLEVAPITANKGLTVRWFLAEYKFQDDLPVYFGDDNKDEEAFEVIRDHGGLSIGVGNHYPLLQADEHLASPDVVRSWLKALISAH